MKKRNIFNQVNQLQSGRHLTSREEPKRKMNSPEPPEVDRTRVWFDLNNERQNFDKMAPQAVNSSSVFSKGSSRYIYANY